MIIAVVLTSLMEAYSKQVDNLTLSLYFGAMLQL